MYLHIYSLPLLFLGININSNTKQNPQKTNPITSPFKTPLSLFQGFRGTVKDFPGFNANSDAEDLYNAMKGFGSDKEAILDLITSRSNAQRQEICTAYKSLYGKDLIADLKYELTGKFERLIVSLMKSPAHHDAKEIKDAIKGAGTNERCLIEILASRTNEQIHSMVAAYKEEYGRDIEEDVVGDTSGHFKKMLVALLQGARDDDGVVYEDLVEEDAQHLYAAGEEQWGTDEAIFIMLLGNRSRTHLQLGTDEDTIINIVTKRSNAQRQEIRQVFKSLLGRDLMADLKSELSKNLCRLIMGLMMTPAEFDAKMMKKAMEGAGTDEHALIEILVTRSNEEIQAMGAAYKKAFKKSLEDGISSDTSGHFRRILISLAQGARDEGPADMAKVKEDAQALADACNADSDERIDKFMSILCTRSFPHLKKVFQEFVKCSNKDIEQIIKKEMSGDVKNVFFAIVRSVKNQPSYLADRLYKAMKGLGTDDRALIRIMVSRSEVDLFNIRKEFKDTHDASLHEFIQVETMVLFRNFPSALNFLSVQRRIGKERRDRKFALTGLHRLHHQNSL
ncbi:Annexin A6 [Bagarius yarrelli]|uniref:Annexin n=1 Tax=Bagarius yarrelli TaxID=175774 RepID=A0A556V4V2_BAGYA|nr:Annexin A6 [Bagarius yarrelli]